MTRQDPLYGHEIAIRNRPCVREGEVVPSHRMRKGTPDIHNRPASPRQLLYLAEGEVVSETNFGAVVGLV